jgi:hypothetical protein
MEEEENMDFVEEVNIRPNPEREKGGKYGRTR